MEKLFKRALPKFVVDHDISRDRIVIKLIHGTRVYCQNAYLSIRELFEDEEIKKSFTADDLATNPIIQTTYLRMMQKFIKEANTINECLTRSDYVKAAILGVDLGTPS